MIQTSRQKLLQRSLRETPGRNRIVERAVFGLEQPRCHLCHYLVFARSAESCSLRQREEGLELCLELPYAFGVNELPLPPRSPARARCCPQFCLVEGPSQTAFPNMEQARRLSLREQGRNIGCGAPLSGSIVAQPRIHKATLSHALLHKVDPSLVEPGPYR